MELYGRVLEIETDSAVFRYPDHSIHLGLNRDVYPEPDDGVVTLYNLAPETIRQFRPGAGITIRAGYSANIGQVFSGTIEDVSVIRGIPDTETRLSVVDGSSRYLRYPINTLFSGWRSGQRIIYDGLHWANTEVVIHPDTSDRLYRDYSISGVMASEITPLLKDLGATGHIYDGRMYIHPINTPVFGTVKVSAKKGLISQPLPLKNNETGESGYSVQTFLFHQLRPGGQIEIESRDVSGTFVIRKLVYTVSDADFVCDMEVY
jgi:hypothetical protein